MLLTARVIDLACLVRETRNVPISAQNLIWDGKLLTDPSLSLAEAFGPAAKAGLPVEVTVVRRTLTEEEQAVLFKQLIRAAAGGMRAEVRELLKEGAMPDFDASRCPVGSSSGQPASAAEGEASSAAPE
jgi:hypothetical protein